MKKLVLGVTGATGALAAQMVLERSPWPVALIASEWGRDVARRELGSFDALVDLAAETHADTSLSATIASGSVPTVGMVVLPCTSSTLGKVAGGINDSLIARAAHCHLKERRRLILGLRETPLTAIDLENAVRVDRAGGIVMPLSPPYYMFSGRKPEDVTMRDLLGAYVDRVLQLLGLEPKNTWETVR